MGEEQAAADAAAVEGQGNGTQAGNPDPVLLGGQAGSGADSAAVCIVEGVGCEEWGAAKEGGGAGGAAGGESSAAASAQEPRAREDPLLTDVVHATSYSCDRCGQAAVCTLASAFSGTRQIMFVNGARHAIHPRSQSTTGFAEVEDAYFPQRAAGAGAGGVCEIVRSVASAVD